MDLFLAPHFDDAVLSCGGTIHKLTAAGEYVTVLTAMGGSPEPGRIPDTPIVRELHARWEQGNDPVKARVQEDEDAVGGLGAVALHLVVWTDCIYRMARGGKPLYPTNEAIFGDVASDDPAAKLLPTVVPPLATSPRYVYAPMGVGHHVDHQIVRDWGIALKKQNPSIALKFYEEYPYMQDKAAGERALSFFSTRQFPLQLKIDMVQLTEADVAAKLQAISLYKTQISSFWDSTETMDKVTRQAMNEAGGGQPGERYWSVMD